MELNVLSFIYNFTAICSQGSDQQQVSIGSNNGLVPYRREAIISTKDDLLYWCIYALLSLNELKISNTFSLTTILTIWPKMISWYSESWNERTHISVKYMHMQQHKHNHFVESIVQNGRRNPLHDVASRKSTHCGLVMTCGVKNLGHH